MAQLKNKRTMTPKIKTNEQLFKIADNKPLKLTRNLNSKGLSTTLNLHRWMGEYGWQYEIKTEDYIVRITHPFLSEN